MPSALYRPLPCNSPWLTPGLSDRVVALRAQRKSLGAIAERIQNERGITLSKKAIANRLRRLGAPSLRQNEGGDLCADAISLHPAAGFCAYRGGRLLTADELRGSDVR